MDKSASISPPRTPPSGFGGNWFRLSDGPMDPALNMARDEALLVLAGTLAAPVFRTYSWVQPAATFGYSQAYQEIIGLTHLRPCIRRTTGGGLVPHDGDWTYSLILPPNHPWYSWQAAESYHQLHEWLRRSFATLGIDTRLAPSMDSAGPGQCFVGSEKSDLMYRGEKLAGAAQRRTKSGQLIQGSIQPVPKDLKVTEWIASMEDEARKSWDVAWRELPPTTPLEPLASGLVASRYGLEAFNRRR